MAEHGYLGGPSRRRWRVLSRDEQAAHPLAVGWGALAVIAVWFLAAGTFELRVAVRAELPLTSVFFTLLTFAAAFGLGLKARWGFVLALFMAARQVFGFVYLVAGGGVDVPLVAAAYAVGNALLGIWATYYLVEGARPNVVFLGRVREGGS